MNTHDRLFNFRHAFEHPVTVWLLALAAIIIISGFVITLLLRRMNRLSDERYTNLIQRIISWVVLVPLLIIPVLLGAAWTIGAVCILSLLCYREFARATGSFRHREISIVVVIGILLITFAVLDHWYDFFVALTPIVIAFIAAVALFKDEPKGYIQRVGIGIFGFLFFGVSFGHLSYMANDVNYRPLILMTIFLVELNDVFAYLCGSLFGRHKLAPNTSPNKTVEGSIGALILTTALGYFLARHVFAGTQMTHPLTLLVLGMLISITGQFGDLMLSSVKRDIGLKDMNTLIPGHGGLLDRFDSLVLAAPAVFHYVGYFNGFGLSQATHIITGGQ